MQRLIHLGKRFLQDESGPAAIEYAVLIGTAMLVCIGGVNSLGSALTTSIQDSTKQIGAATGISAGSGSGGKPSSGDSGSAGSGSGSKPSNGASGSGDSGSSDSSGSKGNNAGGNGSQGAGSGRPASAGSGSLSRGS